MDNTTTDRTRLLALLRFVNDNEIRITEGSGGFRITDKTGILGTVGAANRAFTTWDQAAEAVITAIPSLRSVAA